MTATEFPWCDLIVSTFSYSCLLIISLFTSFGCTHALLQNCKNLFFRWGCFFCCYNLLQCLWTGCPVISPSGTDMMVIDDVYFFPNHVLFLFYLNDVISPKFPYLEIFPIFCLPLPFCACRPRHAPDLPLPAPMHRELQRTLRQGRASRLWQVPIPIKAQ